VFFLSKEDNLLAYHCLYQAKGLKLNVRFFFKTSKIASLLKFNIFYANTVAFNKVFIKHNYCLSSCSNIYTQTKLLYFPIISVNRGLVFYKSKNFLRVNNLQFVIKKKLNLRKQKIFFYSVHIAAPKKKTKK
jgi:hypothetical protein